MYLALYRKWRPKVFNEIFSQKHVTDTLRSEIKNGRVAHAYLFTGSRGTGKTSCAKIFAKAVNCLAPDGGEPCLKCAVCRGLEDGKILDVVEMDAASNNGVDDIRMLREAANFTPAQCKYRVYIIDEAHMLSGSAFNAFLKIMEEPPRHVIFILATTEVHKIPATIISRCQRFDFKRVCREDIQKRLLEIAEEEKVSLQAEAAAMIARISDGAMRDALSLLDQCMAFGESITEEMVVETAGITGTNYIVQLHKNIENKDVPAALRLIDEVYAHSVEPQKLCEDMLTFYRDLLMTKTLPAQDLQLSTGLYPFAELSKCAEDISVDKLLQTLQKLQNIREQIAFQSNKKIALEIGILQLCISPNTQTYNADGRKKEKGFIEAGSVPPGRQMENFTDRPSVERQSIQKQNTLSQRTEKTEKTSNDNDPPWEIVKEESETENKPEDQSNASASGDDLLKIYQPWPMILEELQQNTKTAMIYGFLANSKAMVKGDKLFIQAASPIVANKVLEKKKILDEIIERYSGKTYRMFFKQKASSYKEEKGKSNPVFEKMIDKMKSEGIPIQIENNGGEES